MVAPMGMVNMGWVWQQSTSANIIFVERHHFSVLINCTMQREIKLKKAPARKGIL
jgi:hypothetical protein